MRNDGNVAATAIYIDPEIHYPLPGRSFLASDPPRGSPGTCLAHWHTLAPGCLTAEGAGATIPCCCPFIVTARATQLRARAARLNIRWSRCWHAKHILPRGGGDENGLPVRLPIEHVCSGASPSPPVRRGGSSAARGGALQDSTQTLGSGAVRPIPTTGELRSIGESAHAPTEPCA
jgi:hypothetical protein